MLPSVYIVTSCMFVHREYVVPSYIDADVCVCLAACALSLSSDNPVSMIMYYILQSLPPPARKCVLLGKGTTKSTNFHLLLFCILLRVVNVVARS